jgi:hypothetical protein
VRRARAGQTVLTALAALTVLFAVLLGAHLLAPGAANAAEPRVGGAGLASQGWCHHESGSDNGAGHLRPRTRHSVGNQVEPESWPTGGLTVAFAGIGAIDAWHDGYRTASRYGAGVPPRDTSPAALRVFRC